jgi:hypothetical protein
VLKSSCLYDTHSGSEGNWLSELNDVFAEENIKRLVAAVMKFKVIWDMIHCQMVVSCRRFGRSWCLLFRVLASYKVSKSVDGMDSDDGDYINYQLYALIIIYS